jgi:predicted RNase H-like HicB family nuclease
MQYRIEIEREEDGRWLADVVDLPGAMAYGETSDEAVTKAEALALRVLADRLEHGEYDGPRSISFDPTSPAE